ncbi:MAG: response regulator [Ignavibacteriales bacterium]|nr:response regulator [Ignavibacteriales bacterium]
MSSSDKKKKLLVVDDEELVRKMVTLWFEREGFSVISAENGTEGLRLAIQEKPDVVLLDIMMPGLHGFEVCKRIREQSSLAQTIIIMTSARSFKPDLDKAKELGANDYVIKPSDSANLLNTVNKHLAKAVRP